MGKLSGKPIIEYRDPGDEVPEAAGWRNRHLAVVRGEIVEKDGKYYAGKRLKVHAGFEGAPDADASTSKAPATDIHKMTKDELVAHAAGIGLTLDPSMLKAEMLEAVESS